MGKRITIVGFIAAGVALILYLIRKQPQQVVQQNVPNPAGSGINPNAPQAQAYNVAPFQPGVTPGFTYAPQDYSPYSPAGSNYYYGAPQMAPVSSTYNQPKAQTIPDVKPKTDCGCGGHGACESCLSDCSIANSRFPDGRGGCLASSRRQQIESAGGSHAPAFQNYANNLATGGADFFMLMQDFEQSRARANGETPAANIH